MASYTNVTVENYNQSPPSDDGSQTSANKATWSGVKTKLGDPLKTAIEAVDTNVDTAFTALGTAADVNTGTSSGNVPLVGTTSATDSLAGLLETATQAEQETASATDKAVTPGRQQYHPSACKGWVKFTPIGGTGSATVNASYNVDSVDDDGTGNFGVNWSVAFSSANYCVTVTAGLSSGPRIAYISSQAAGAVEVDTTNSGAVAADPDFVCVSAFGDQ